MEIAMDAIPRSCEMNIVEKVYRFFFVIVDARGVSVHLQVVQHQPTTYLTIVFERKLATMPLERPSSLMAN